MFHFFKSCKHRRCTAFMLVRWKSCDMVMSQYCGMVREADMSTLPAVYCLRWFCIARVDLLFVTLLA